MAVTERGVAAWIADRDGVQRLLAASPGGGVSELDRGPSGSIAALAADGTRIRWTRDGAPRSAEPP